MSLVFVYVITCFYKIVFDKSLQLYYFFIQKLLLLINDICLLILRATWVYETRNNALRSIVCLFFTNLPLGYEFCFWCWCLDYAVFGNEAFFNNSRLQRLCARFTHSNNLCYDRLFVTSNKVLQNFFWMWSRNFINNAWFFNLSFLFFSSTWGLTQFILNTLLKNTFFDYINILKSILFHF